MSLSAAMRKQGEMAGLMSLISQIGFQPRGNQLWRKIIISSYYIESIAHLVIVCYYVS